MMTITI